MKLQNYDMADVKFCCILNSNKVNGEILRNFIALLKFGFSNIIQA